MTHALELPRPIMRRRARLDTDKAWLKGSKHDQQLVPSNLSAQHWLPRLINTVKLENVLGYIQTNSGNLHADGSFPLMVTDSIILARIDAAGSGAVHLITGFEAVNRGDSMSRPHEKRETKEQDLFRSRLDQIIDMNHQLVRLAKVIDWSFLEDRFGAVYSDGPGMPPLPTRLMAGLAILKYTFDLSDEALCERWVENPYYQFLCGEEFFQHCLPFDRSSMTRWR
jgi:hypothetical protein